MYALLIVVALIAAAMFFLGPSPPALPRFRGGSSKRCQRCFRNVDRLRPYVDGRREFWICDMCAAEMEFAHSDKVDLPRG